MVIVLKILALILGGAAGVGCIKYSYPLTHLVGHNSLAERYLGTGGTYTMWKLIGLVILIWTIWYVF